MLYRTELETSLQLHYDYGKFDLYLNENLRFCITPQQSRGRTIIFDLHDFVGDFDIVEISFDYDSVKKIDYDKGNQRFIADKHEMFNSDFFKFRILANFELKKVGYVNIAYNLKFPEDRLRHLKLFEYFEEYFVLPKYEFMKFKYYVIKIKNDIEYVEINIENPLNVQIEYGKKKTTSDLIGRFSTDEEIDMNLVFVFDPLNDKNITKNSIDSTNSVLAEKNNDLAEIMLNTDFADVVIFSASNKEILSFRCVLANSSTFFSKRFEEDTEIPVKFNLKDVHTETIKAALDFCYGKRDAIFGKEAKLLEFANKYSFEKLKDACSEFIEKIDF